MSPHFDYERRRPQHGPNNPAWVEFWTHKTDRPGHAEFMERAAKRYPKLPPGAQQNALHCLETLGKGHAKRYAANALARQSAHERRLMGTTLTAWRAKVADELKPYHPQGVITSARSRLYTAMATRMAEYKAECERERLAKRAKMFAPPPSAVAINAARLGLQVVNGGRI